MHFVATSTFRDYLTLRPNIVGIRPLEGCDDRHSQCANHELNKRGASSSLTSRDLLQSCEIGNKDAVRCDVNYFAPDKN